MKLNKKQREKLGQMFSGKCAYCGCELKRGWHADHVEPIFREWWKREPLQRVEVVDGKFKIWEEKQKIECRKPEHDVISNLFPACRTCNLSKSAYSLEDWRGQLAKQVRMARDYSINFRWAEKFGLVKETGEPVVFYFERCAGRIL